MDPKIKQKDKVMWLGRPVLSAEHLKDLERQSAVGEFLEHKPRAQAESDAYRAYVKNLHVAGAAHHLAGLQAMQAVGQTEDARKHALLYSMHTKALGYDPDQGHVPLEVKARLENDTANGKGPIEFKHSTADQMLLDGKKEPGHPENAE